MSWWDYGRYVRVGERRAEAARELLKLSKEGRKITPVKVDGRKIAATFWGKAWCDNLESYSDFANRLPRGRTYVRNGSVVDLQVEPGRIRALVSGSSLYTIEIEIKRLAGKAWTAIRRECAGKIGSIIELLQGRLSSSVMEIITRRGDGMFPTPKEISMECSCPDWAGLCKHLAAVLYGVGARLDREPELLFTLRQVDHFALIAAAEDVRDILKPGSARKTIAPADLGDVFGIDLEAAPVPSAPGSAAKRAKSEKPAPRSKSPRPKRRKKTAARRSASTQKPRRSR